MRWMWVLLIAMSSGPPPQDIPPPELEVRHPKKSPWQLGEREPDLLLEPPDMILLDGKIYTGDPARPFVEAIAIRKGSIEALGTSEEIRPMAGEKTRLVSLGGRFACPGFIDAHAHMASLGQSMRSVDLVGTRSFADVIDRVRERAGGVSKGRWIVGRGWDQNDWKEKDFPHHGPLSEAVEDHPAWLVRVGGHAGIANEAALRLAGITKATPDPEGGLIRRAPDSGEATGVLIDAAMSLVTRRIPPVTPAQIREQILEAQAACLRAGLTEVHDAGIGPETIRIYEDLDRGGLLKIRIYALASGDRETLEEVFSDGPRLPRPGGRLTVRAIKLVADGALGSRGAALLEEYSDEPGNRGLMTIRREEMLETVRWALRKGLQVCTHAIGDAANRMTLDCYEAAMKGHEGPSPRLRVEHAQIVSPEDIPRFGALGVIASMQPTHCTSDMPWAGDRVGPKRLSGAYAWRTILEAGGRIAAGSDFPVESEAPLWGIYAALTRQDHDAKPEGGWRPHERLGVEEAIRAYTADAAFASFEDHLKGTLTTGRWADIVILEKDITSIPPREILRTGVWATIVGGQLVFQAE